MNFNRNSFYLLFIVFIFCTACGKNDNGPPPNPPKFDTLGIGWQKISLPDTLNLSDIFFVDDVTGYLCGNAYLAKSINGGLSWSRYILPDSVNEQLINIFFLDKNHGWVVGNEFLLRTENGGTSWQFIRIPSNKMGVPDVQFLTNSLGYMTKAGAIYKSIDGGLTWTKAASFNNASGLFFLNLTTGWVTGGAIIKRTDNGGSSFSFEKSISDGNYSIQFTDNLHGWVTGGPGIVWRTIDGGNNWEQLTEKGFGGDLSFFDNNNGYILSGSKIYKTTDGGKTLDKQSSIHKGVIVEIHFTNLNHGWAVGSNGGVYRFSK